MQTYRAYLCGPITGFSYSKVTDWREKAAVELAKHNIVSYSPMRGKSYLKDLGPLSADCDTHDGGVEVSMDGVMMRDYLDVIRSHVIVAYLPTENIKWPSVGSCIEMGWAFDRRIPVVAITAKDGCYMQHPMANRCITYRVDTLEQGIYIATSLTNP